MSKAVSSLARDDGDSDEDSRDSGTQEPAGGEGDSTMHAEALPRTPVLLPVGTEAGSRLQQTAGESSLFDEPAINIKQPWTTRTDGGINSRIAGTNSRGDEIYYCGVIDILQKYNTHKHGETIIKSLYLDTSTISSVDPDSYAKRFIKFLEDHTD